MKKSLLLIRGIPNAGKSFLAELIAENKNAIICEADQYFMVDGEYKFDANKLNLAHNFCKNKAEKGMRDNVDLVIVSNTSSTDREINVYKELAEQYNYIFISIIVENRRGGKSIHNVPAETILKMRDRFVVSI